MLLERSVTYIKYAPNIYLTYDTLVEKWSLLISKPLFIEKTPTPSRAGPPDHGDPRFRSLSESFFHSFLGGEDPSSSLDYKQAVSNRLIS